MNTLIRAALAAAASLAAIAVADTASAAPAGDYGIVGHRGDATSVYTENTLASLRAAKQAGATAVEVDFRVTRDDKLIAMHDGGLGRTTTCTGLVHELKRAWIVKNCRGENRNERIPTLAEVLDWGNASNMNILIELKRGPRWNAARVKDAVAAVRSRGAARFSFLSFDAGLLDVVEATAPSLDTKFIISGNRQPEWAAGRFDSVTIGPAHATPERVAALEEMGLRVFGRVANTRRVWRKYWSAGLEGFLTDRPGAAAQARS